MDISTIQRDGVTVIGLPCNLDGTTSNEAQEKIMPLLVKECCVVLDLGQCDYISSAGLRVLLMMAKSLGASGGKLGLCGVSSEIRDIMDMTGFLDFFKIYDTVDGAVEGTLKEKKC
ncbi:MAG: STAS domain-containing protein [Candidatus Omnitrophota bacterium]